MATFKYRVRTQDSRIQAGVVDATDMNEANAALSERGFEILVLEPFTAPTLRINNLSLFNRISPKDVVVVARTLSVMVSASVPLVDALKNIARQTANPNMRAAR